VEIEQTLDEIAAFFEKAALVEGITTTAKEELEPASDVDIDGFARKFTLTIPEDVRRFWRRGLEYRHLSIGSGGDGFATAGFDWYSLEYLARDIPMNRDEIAPIYEPDTDERRLLEKGIMLSYSEPQIVWDPRGGITHFSTRNDLQPPVTRSLAEFLEHWLEAGCFSSHAVSKWLPKIQHLVPGRIPPEKNLWITYYKKVFAAYA
jgi:hypothetical protein